MSLAEYIRKRHFDKTPEPVGKPPPVSQRQPKTADLKKLEFVVQKHHASQLHYDFRLELDGVLKSWAVPKGPSLNPHDKRLAMMVEDHPYEYRTFEGVIPEGNYGAGKVVIWDRGWYLPEKTLQGKVSSGEPTSISDRQKVLRQELKAGHLTFILHGQKLKGEFALVRAEHMSKNAWLLIKKGDEYASSA
ncbi:3'-phosphoesterase [Candidatus Saccharibacteria bacterium]|nr:3'-phosphoesterase [Candidatus Saccharibacteria bacterium]